MFSQKLKEHFYSIIVDKPEVLEFVQHNGNAGFMIIDCTAPSNFWINPLLAYELSNEGNNHQQIPIEALFNKAQFQNLINAEAVGSLSGAEIEEEVFIINVTTGMAEVAKCFEVHRLPLNTISGSDLLLLAFNHYDQEQADTIATGAHRFIHFDDTINAPFSNLSGLIHDLNRQSISDLLARFISNSSEGIMLNMKGKVLYTSPSFTRITGYTANDMNSLGPAGMFELIHAEDKGLHEIAIFKALKENTAYMSTQLRFRTKEGKYIWVDNVNYYYYEGGECMGGITVFKDISVLKHDAALQQTSSQIHENLLNAIPDMLFFLDKDGHYIGVKANDQSKLIHEPAKLLYRNYREVMPKNIISTIEQAYHEISTLGRAYPFEYKLDIDNKEYFFECRLFKIDEDLFGALVRDITDEHSLKLKLEEREKLYDSMLNNLPGGTYRTLADPNWTALYISRWVETKFGHKVSDYVWPNKRNRFDMVHPDDFKQAADAVKAALERVEPWELEYRICDINGAYHWVLDKGHTVKDKDGNALYRDGIILDIEERKLNEEKLKEQENIINSFYDNSPLMMGVIELIDGCTDDFLVVRGNKLAARFCGLNTKEIINAKASAIGLSKEIATLWYSKYKEAELHEEGISFESEHKLDDKTYILACTAKYLGNFNYSKKLYAFTAQDVTNERMVQRRLSESEGKLRTIAENIQEVFYMYNLVENKYEFISPNVEELLGVPLDFFYSGASSYVEQYALPEYKSWKIDALEAMNAGLPHTVEYQVYYYDDIKWIREKCFPVQDSAGNLLKISGVCVDITKEKTAELELKRQQEMQALLTSLASEFINIPIDSIHNSVENALEHLAHLLGAQRGFVFRYLPNNEFIHCVHEWVDKGVHSIREVNEIIPALHVASWHHTHSQRASHFIPDTHKVKNKFNREAFERNGVKSVFTIPFFEGEHCEGFIGFDWIKQHSRISDQERTTLTLFARMFENLLQRQKTEHKLRETKESLERISELARVGGFSKDMVTNKIEWSRVTYQIYGLEPDTPIDETLVFNLYKEGEHRNKLLHLIERCNEFGEEYDDEFLIKSADGTEKWVRTIATPVFEDGKLVKFYGTVQDIDHLKRTKEKLESTRLQMESILKEMDDVIISIDFPNRNLTFVTPSINKLLEMDDLHLQADLPDMDKIFHPEDMHIRLEMADELTKNGTFEKNFRIVTPSGKIKWVKDRAKLIYNEDGVPVRLDSHVVDITRQKEYEDQLQVQAEILENIGEAVVATNQSGQIIYTNKAARDIFKIDTAEIQTENISRLLQTDCNTSIDLNMWAEQNQVYTFEHLVSSVNGEESSLLVSISPFKKRTGTLKGFICIATDITTLKQKQKQLADSEEQAKKLAKRYKDIIDNESIYVVKTDVDGRYTFVNDHFKKIYGFSNKILGEYSFGAVIEDDLQKLMHAFQLCFDEPEVPHEVILRKPDEHGNILYSKWEFKGIRDNESNKVEEILSVGFDISEQIQSLKKAEHLLNLSSEQNFKLKSFAYIVSHNIRSHSANMTSIVEFLSEAGTQEEADAFINMLKSSTKQLDETIHNLNEIITINENVSKPKEKKFLHNEIKNTLEILSGLIIKEGVQIINQVSVHEHIYVIASYLDSILLNLIGNAIKYRSPQRKPTIELSTYNEGRYKVLEVKDNGLGLDLKKYGNKVFGMYKTFHGNEDARGFGLYITKTQIEAMGGKITLASEVDKGSTFKVYFYDSSE